MTYERLIEKLTDLTMSATLIMENIYHREYVDPKDEKEIEELVTNIESLRWKLKDFLQIKLHKSGRLI